MSLSEIRVRIFSPRLDLLARWIAGLTGWKRSAFSFALGAVSVLGFAPFHLWPLLFLTLPSFIWLLDGIALEDRTVSTKPRWRQAALAGWWFGFGFFIASLYWVGFALSSKRRNSPGWFRLALRPYRRRSPSFSLLQAPR